MVMAQLRWAFSGIGNQWNLWVLDITTTGGTTQAYLLTAFPASGPGTHGQSAALAAGLQTSIEGIDGVTACDLAEVTGNGESLSVYELNSSWTASFPAADWAMYAGLPDEVFIPPVVLLTRFPADGMLAQEDSDDLASSLATAYNDLDLTASLTLTEQVFAPSSVI